jgi:5-formaminoimidazole-4-carboxamide-1-beta-D-ribofuranosyl 5'-monophosphate synthetase
MPVTTEQLDKECFARPQWQQIGEMGDTLTESLTEAMHEAIGDYLLDIAQDLVSGGKIGDDTLARVNDYLGSTVKSWLERNEQEIFDHFSEQQ